ncbi:MAG TPA: GNAT family N-acetyltransferase [Candidatus Dormibacteraeota bacterium]|nr:GNAT family N-acetyltransferase [Candidatus Dormibacteraeota bacterium]
MTVELFGVTDREAMAAAFAIRKEIFVREQGVPEAEEIDEHDSGDSLACHVLLRDEDARPIATGRFFVRAEDTVQIGRMAVLEAFRGRGIGRQMLDALMAEAQRRGYRRVVLHAQTHARGFYELAGYVAHGPVFFDAGIEHIEMARPLDASPPR